MASSDAAGGGRPDFDDVYRDFHTRIRRYLERLLGTGDAEDATQDVFTKVSQALPQFKGHSSLSTWVYRIATNAAYDRLRSRSSRRAGELPLAGEAPPAEPLSSRVEENLVRKEMTDCIDGYIARLPANYRAVVILSEHEGLTNQEMAEALGVSIETVKIRLHRARARLKKELGAGCNFYRDGRNELACDPKPKGVSRRD